MHRASTKIVSKLIFKERNSGHPTSEQASGGIIVVDTDEFADDSETSSDSCIVLFAPPIHDVLERDAGHGNQRRRSLITHRYSNEELHAHGIQEAEDMSIIETNRRKPA